MRTYVHAIANGVSCVTPMPPCICTVSSMTFSAMRGDTTLICEIHSRASVAGALSIIHAAFRHNNRACSISMRASAMMS